MKVYGSNIRKLPILVSTEADTFWLGILEANHVQPQSRTFTSTDYVKLVNPMKLKEYSIYFSNYPWLPFVEPFSTWGTTSATNKDIPWHDAYNAVKHDREGIFLGSGLNHDFSALNYPFRICRSFLWKTLNQKNVPIFANL